MSSKNLDIETQIILYCIDKKKDQLIEGIDFKNIDWNKMLCKASLNRVLYIFAKNLLALPGIQDSHQLMKNLTLIVFEGRNWLNKLRKTLEFIDLTFLKTGIPFLIVKTYKDLPYVTRDVDVLVKLNDFENAEKVLKSEGGKLKKYQPKAQTDIILPNLLRIDLHKGFFWQGSDYLDPHLIWKNPRKQEIQGIDCPIPNIETEIILAIAHTLYERLHIPLLEFLFIKNNCLNVDWKVILEQTKKYGWPKAFLRFISIFNELSCKIYYQKSKKPLIHHLFKNYRLKCCVKTPLSMPYMYPISYAMEIFLERMHTRSYIPMFDIFYYLFTLFRHYYTRKQRVPIYDHWFPFERLKWGTR